MSDDDLTSRTLKTGFSINPENCCKKICLAKETFLDKNLFLIAAQEKGNVVLGLQLVQIDDPCRAIGI